MAFEVTYDCDVCGNVGGAESTYRKAIFEAKTFGFSVMRIDGKLRCVCRRCVRELGGENAARRTIRKAVEPTHTKGPSQKWKDAAPD